MKIFIYLLHFLCYVTFILPGNRSLVDPNRCSKLYGQCKKRCSKHEKQIEICLSPSKICCIERAFEEDLS
ncbi:beta-defensin 114 [Balaenoptera ricei]|uniref:Beta-defensin n=1 Tax=Balaenoptera musculus TaxID=9771 RepID=A0A8B8YVZ3_BALMU|nr:beta-defensin 114 [Balaenoptera musculus]XP_059793980.1 beta-defensin 114 [Balaenoptera ricei]